MSFALTRRGLYGLAALIACSPWLAADDLAPGAEILPQNTVVYFSIPSVEDFGTQFSDTNLGRLINDASMAETRAQIMKKFEEESAKAEKEIGMPLSDVLSIPTGEATFAVIAPPGEKLGLVLLLDVAGREEQLEQLLEKAEEEMEEAGELTRSEEEIDGTTVTVWTNAEALPNAPFNSFSYFVRESRFVITSGLPVADLVITRWEGADDSFAGNDVFEYMISRCDPDEESSLVWFIDPIGLVKAGIASAGPEVGMQAGMAMAFLPVLGLDRLKGMGGTLILGTEEFDMVSRTLVHVQQPPTGILRAFVCPPADLSPPKSIPADVTTINALNWDVQGAYEAISQTVDMFSAPGTTERFLNQAAEAPNGPGVHPKEDFLDLLNGRIYVVQNFPKGGTAEDQQLLFLLGVNDEQRMQEVVAKVMDSAGADTTSRDFRGTRIYEQQNQQGPFQPAIAISGGYLMFGMNVGLLESVLRGDSDSLVGSDLYQEVKQHIPAQVSTMAFSQSDRAMEMLFESMKEAMQDNPDFDASVLPDFDAIRKYFTVSGSYSVPDENGVYAESFSLKAND